MNTNSGEKTTELKGISLATNWLNTVLWQKVIVTHIWGSICAYFGWDDALALLLGTLGFLEY